MTLSKIVKIASNKEKFLTLKDYIEFCKLYLEFAADWSKLPYEQLGIISNRIINEVTGVNRVVFDISSKPPGTIEWE